jgi:oligopeptide transport system ATP-binding protein
VSAMLRADTSATSQSSEAPILAVRDLSKSFPARRDVIDVLRRRRPTLVAVDGVTFDLRAHQAIGIVGESGSGKSTVAKCIVRLHEPDAGTIIYRGADVRGARRKELARIRRAVQLIYQDPYASLNPLMSVEGAVAEPAEVHGLIPKTMTPRQYAAEVLDLVGLDSSIGRRRPNQLSGGQRQRVAIARAMAVQPEVLIADEPVSALDVSIQAQVLNVFEKLRAEQGVAIIMIAHQLPVVAMLADTILVMYLGRIVEAGPAHEVFGSPGHPYTVALLESQPGPHRRAERRRPVLEGEIPSPLRIPSGCRFRTRCPIAQPICSEVDPPPMVLPGGQRAWCHFADEVKVRGSSITDHGITTTGVTSGGRAQ